MEGANERWEKKKWGEILMSIFTVFGNGCLAIEALEVIFNL